MSLYLQVLRQQVLHPQTLCLKVLHFRLLCARILFPQTFFQIHKIGGSRLQEEGMKAKIGILFLPQFLCFFLEGKNFQITEIIL